jgi:diaminopimelate decarboxylase
MDKEEVLAVAEINEASFYLYDLRVIEKQAAQVKATLPEFRLLYSIKANPHPSIVKHLVNMGFGFDAASVNEVKLALSQGSAPNNIYYSTPGKTIHDLNAALSCCEIIADSINELIQLNSLACSSEYKIRVGVRLNVKNKKIVQSKHEVMGGDASKFGISMDDFTTNNIKKFSNIDIVGIHIYFGSQLLDVKLISNNFHIIADTVLSLKDKINIQYVNFGGGFGVPYEKSETSLDIKQLSELLHNDLLFWELTQTSVNLNLELGRYLVAECGYFVSRILDIKNSYGKKYAIIDSGMNAFYRPIMTGDFHDIIQFNANGEPEIVTLVGKLCTPIDKYYEDIALYPLKVNDIIVFKNAGAYGYSMSLLEFISHNKPKEIIIGEK